jgi:hypothetical protein
VRTTVLFAGAGASKAINPKEYPTTVEFFDRLPKSIRDDTLFQLALQYLKGEAVDGVVDIEQIFWVLQELRDFLKTVRNSSTVPGWFLQAHRLGKPVGMHLDFKQLMEASASIDTVMNRLVDNINQRVYDFYARPPEEEELTSNWVPMLTALLSIGDRLEIFTTNYDINIEVAIDLLSRNPQLPTIDTGVRGPVQRYLDLSIWAGSARKPDSVRAAGMLTKLHGSVDWSRGPDRIYVGDPLFKGSHEKHVVEYPGFKGIPDREPFNTFHNYFATSLAAATHLVFVGFAFRDEYINSLLVRLTSASASVLLINPVAVKDLPFPAERVNHIELPFNTESVTRMVQEIAHNKSTAKRGA